MIFCGSELAARIERAEVRLVVDACRNVAQRVADVFVQPVCGGVAAFTEPGSPLNKVAGLGFAEFDASAFERIEEVHAARRAALQVELATLADPTIARWLTGRGYELVGVENVLGRSLATEARSPASPVIRVSLSSADELERWLDTVVTGFATPDPQGAPAHEEFERSVLERVIRDFSAADGVVRYLAELDGRAAGGAALRMGEGVAQLCGAATLPGLRRRGVQGALLARRLADAARQGCDIAVVTTQPGSVSQHNVQRQGFELLYSRNVLRREPR
ncbi:MAG: GNAT family N-acetyltransferase [Planctomycetes bacterium]|nr:GNAT family N-acetyltransferase [Planctomycetota bacterium]